MSLEEYEPNPEFVGRNFNAGEVIQLVLRAPRTGDWLGFRSVQMVMMHELAHCKQMNHSGAFWQVRNQFADELRKLWERNYTGDGFWGKGKTLLSGQYEPVSGLKSEIILRSLCGGTFRSSRRRKRKRKGNADGANKLSYAERQQRRIAKKFGTQGVTLGNDIETRVKLEDGKKPKGKPRVAGSVRGRELRAAAALARFGNQKEEDEGVKSEEPEDTGSETESEQEDVSERKEALDLDGSRLLDPHGHGMIKVCEDEDQADIHVKQEMEELQDLEHVALHPTATSPSSNRNMHPGQVQVKREENSPSSPPPQQKSSTTKTIIQKNPPPSPSPSTNHTPPQPPSIPPLTIITTTTTTCPICSLANPPLSTLCIACAHVLDRNAHPGHWRCTSAVCIGVGVGVERESENANANANAYAYVNSRDCGICGVCGTRRS